MDRKLIIWINTICFFIGWTVIMLAGADFPPPVGFIWVVLLIIVLDFVQYKYLPYFLDELSKNVKTAFIKNLLFFTIGGLGVSLFSLIARIEVTIDVGIINNLIWIGVVTGVGIIYGIGFWLFNLLLLNVGGKKSDKK